MNKLDQLLLIPDVRQRREAMLKYAVTLRVPSSEAGNSSNYNEEKLVLLIYDAERRGEQNRYLNYKFYFSAFFTGGILFSLIYFGPRMFLKSYRQDTVSEAPQGKVLQGFNEQGKPLVEEGKPILFKMMDGEYDESDSRGKLKYRYVYDQGQLIQKKEFDEKGKVIKVEDYPKE